MKKEDKIKLMKDKRILAGIAALLLLVVVILCLAAVKRSGGQRAAGMAAMKAWKIRVFPISPEKEGRLRQLRRQPRNSWMKWWRPVRTVRK